MIGLLKTFFANEFKEALSPGNVNRPDRIHIATCAILLEMAKIDGEFDDSERQNIIAIFKNKYHLTDDEVTCLIEASEEELERSIDLWQFTNLINKNYSPGEKIGIIETIWQVAYADGRLDEHEDYLIHKLSGILNISHKDMIEAKLKVLHGCEKA
jgi:uncharacterized tellurite resistance protein B-like protein